MKGLHEDFFIFANTQLTLYSLILIHHTVEKTSPMPFLNMMDLINGILKYCLIQIPFRFSFPYGRNWLFLLEP